MSRLAIEKPNSGAASRLLVCPLAGEPAGSEAFMVRR